MSNEVFLRRRIRKEKKYIEEKEEEEGGGGGGENNKLTEDLGLSKLCSFFENNSF